MSIRSQMKATGYDQEEIYFHKRDQELIQKMKQSLGRKKFKAIEGGGSKENHSVSSSTAGKKAA